MSFEALNTTAYPPFYGKNDWFLDPKKIVSRPANFTLETIPEEEEEDMPQTPVIKPETSEKRVKFASYVEVYFRCPVDGNLEPISSKKVDKMIQKNALSVNEKRVKELEYKLKQTQHALSHARTIINLFPLLILLSILIGLVIYHDDVQPEL